MSLVKNFQDKENKHLNQGFKVLAKIIIRELSQKKPLEEIPKKEKYDFNLGHSKNNNVENDKNKSFYMLSEEKSNKVHPAQDFIEETMSFGVLIQENPCLITSSQKLFSFENTKEKEVITLKH